MGRLVGFECWVQRDHLVALDFDASVVGIVSQPFWLFWTPVGGKRRRHAPDFLVRLASGAVMVLDSRPAQLIGERDREAFAATGQACAASSPTQSGNNPPLQVRDDDQWQHRPYLAEAGSTPISPASFSENRQLLSGFGQRIESAGTGREAEDWRVRDR